MPKLEDLDKRSVLSQLKNYKLIVDINSDLLDDDRLLRQQIIHRIGMLESCLNEMEMWERTKDITKYNQSLDQASKLLEGISTLINQMLDNDGYFPAGDGKVQPCS